MHLLDPGNRNGNPVSSAGTVYLLRESLESRQAAYHRELVQHRLQLLEGVHSLIYKGRQQIQR